MKKLNFLTVALFSVLSILSVSGQTTQPDSIFMANLVGSSDVELTITNDSVYPWIVDTTNACITNSNVGHTNTSSTISISYSSDRATEFKVDWLRNYYSSNNNNNTLRLYIDGVHKETCNSSSYTTPRYYLPAGEHTITFYDTITGPSTDNYSRIKNLRIREIIPLETVDSISTNSDVKLTVLYNNPLYPWLYDAANGCITNDNLGFANTSSTITMSYTSDKITEFKVDWLRNYYSSSSNNNTLRLYIDGVHKETCNSSSYTTPRYYLPAGEHTITFYDTITGPSADNYSRIKNLRIREIHPAEVADFVSYSDVDITLSHDTLYPWVRMSDGIITNDNLGFANTSSTITMSYTSDKITEFKVDWLRNYYSSSSNNNTLRLYIDGVHKETCNSSSYTTPRYYLPAGEHTITFYDTITGPSADNYSRIKNLRIRELQPLEPVVLTENSQPLTFTNTCIPEENIFPWTTEDGYIQSTNYGTANSSSRFSTTFTIDEPSLFSFQAYVQHPNNNTGSSYNDQHHLNIIINGEWFTTWLNSTGFKTGKFLLQPGEYHIEWIDTILNTTTQYKTQIKNIELSNDWVEVELEYAGTLGVEVLYKVDILNDVVLLKIKGDINDTDWGYIKQMNNIVGLDLTEANFTSVPDYAFDGLSWLSDVRLPEGITSIGEYAFRGTQIWKMDMPASVTSIGQYAFANRGLKEINFPENSQLKTIGDHAFYNCDYLRTFIMPNTVTSLNVNNNNSATFSGCTRLTTLHFSNALTNIPSYTCDGCSSLVDVKLPENINSIKSYAFRNNTDLQTIDFPESLRTIGDYAFSGTGLDTVKLPLKLSTLGNEAFYNCDSLKYIELPSYIGNYDDNFYDCDAVNKVVCKSATPPGITEDPFREGRAKSSITLVVPSFAVAAYKLDSYWYQFGTIEEGEPLDYWTITDDLMLTNNRRIDGTPDIDIFTTGRLTVAGAAPFPINYLSLDVSASSTSALLNNCKAMYADSIDHSYHLDEANKWYFIVPLYDVDLKRVYHSNGAPFVFRYYDAANRAANGASGSWKNVTDSVLRHGEGYIIRSNATGWMELPAVDSLSASQIFCTEDVTIPLNAQVSDNTANAHWNYVGNPYPCYYDIWYMDFPAPITVWTGSTYKAYSLADDNYALRPMEAFFVQKPDEISEITFHKEGRQVNSDITHTANAPQRRNTAGTKRDVFNITITATNGLSDDTRVVINEQAQRTYEIHCDASKFMSMDATCPQIYTLDDQSTPLAINERPRQEGIVRAGFYAAAAGEYTITANGATGVLIRDLEKQITHNLEVADYRFSVTEAGLCDTRFEFLFSEKQPVVTDIEDTYTTLEISNKNGVLTINNAPADVFIYTVDGRLIEHATADNTHNFTLQQGVYVVQVGNVMSKQIIH